MPKDHMSYWPFHSSMLPTEVLMEGVLSAERLST